jgi:Tfp pilus assembly protein PilX
MKPINFKSGCNKQHQSGIVLFIAMVALVVMSLAAVALIRSVDTNSLIAGNLSFKQTSVVSSSFGIESASEFLGNKEPQYGYVDNPPDGYYALCTATQSSAASLCDGALLLTQANLWSPGVNSRLAEGLNLTNGIDAYGNTIQYVVERMCRDFDPAANPAGSATKSSCLLARRTNDNGSKSNKNEFEVGGPEAVTDLPIFRVTVRVSGPKNTVSYVQAFIS